MVNNKLGWIIAIVVIGYLTHSNRVWLGQRICFGHGLCTYIGRPVNLPQPK